LKASFNSNDQITNIQETKFNSILTNLELLNNDVLKLKQKFNIDDENDTSLLTVLQNKINIIFKNYHNFSDTLNDMNLKMSEFKLNLLNQFNEIRNDKNITTFVGLNKKIINVENNLYTINNTLIEYDNNFKNMLLKFENISFEFNNLKNLNNNLYNSFN